MTESWELRSWPAFFEMSSFRLPENPNIWRDRCQSNFDYYKANYALLALIIFGILIYSNPTYLIPLIMSIGVAITLLKTPNLYIQGHRVGLHEKLVVIIIVTLFGLWVTSTFPIFLWSIGLNFAVIFLHMSLRRNSITKKVTNFVSSVKRDIKDLGKDLVDGKIL